MKLSNTIALMGIFALVAGCAGGMKTMPDGRVLSATTVGDSLDRSATYVQILEPTGVDAEGRPTGYTQVAGDLTVGNTVAGDTIRATVPTAVGGLIQRDAAIRSADIKSDAVRCPEGTQVCHSTINQNQTGPAVANSGSTANAGADVDVAIRETTGCNPCTGDDFDF